MFFLLLCIFLFINSAQASDLTLKTNSSIIKVNSGANLVLDESISSANGRIIKDSGGSISGNNISFTKGILEDSGNKVTISGTLNPGQTNKITLNGNKTLRGSRGRILQSIAISGADNRLEGEFKLNQNIILQDSNTSVTWAGIGRLNAGIELNNGTLFLEEDLFFTDKQKVIGPGKIKCNGRILNFGATNLAWEEPIYFDGGQDITLSSNFSLSSTWTFSGDSILQGNGNILTLETGGQITVEKGGALLLKDITIKNISNANICCLDDLGKIIFQDVKWVQDGNYTFSKGGFEILGNNEFCGPYIFVYNSCVTSTINTNSYLKLDGEFTFSYDPGIASKNLIEFEDNSAMLYLNNATLHITTTGINLKKGQLVAGGHSHMLCQTITGTWGDIEGDIILDQGITFGDQTAGNDFTCKILAGAKLELTKGSLIYKNVNNYSWIAENRSSILQINSGNSLKLYQTLNSNGGQINLQGGTEILYISGKKLLGDINILGPIDYGEL